MTVDEIIEKLEVMKNQGTHKLYGRQSGLSPSAEQVNPHIADIANAFSVHPVLVMRRGI